MTRSDVALCGERTSLRTYNELGTVEPGFCCCFVCVDSNIGTLMPSFGCDRDNVNYIVAQLQARIHAHGDQVQADLQAEVMQKVATVEEKMVLIHEHFAKVKSAHVAPNSLSIDDR